MTNEEALELVKGTERCFVVWATTLRSRPLHFSHVVSDASLNAWTASNLSPHSVHA